MFNRKIISHLVNWKNKKGRKPLVLRGARQVGKTSAILMFAKACFKDLIYINLENVEHSRLFRQELSLKDFEDIIQVKFHKRIVPQDTLVFIDEIQNSPPLIKLLRFFYEQKPDIYVVAAGSLLEAKINKEGFSFPVGRVEFAYLYPLDFFEYLEAKGENELLKLLQDVSFGSNIPEGIHILALNNFYEYAMIGGMPEIVKTYLRSKNPDELRAVYSSLFTSYCEDVYKYSSLAEAKYLNYIIEAAPLFSGSVITYDKFGGSNFRSREMSRAFNTLEKVMLLYQIPATKSKELPLVSQGKRPKKLIFLDVGLINNQMNIQQEFLNIKDFNSFYRGRVAEQVVGQQLLAHFNDSLARIFYWAKDKSEGSAEVDFCLPLKGRIIGIEVKSGTAGRLKSLFSFAASVRNSALIRIYSGSFKEEEIKLAGEKLRLMSVPFYLIPRMLDESFIF